MKNVLFVLVTTFSLVLAGSLSAQPGPRHDHRGIHGPGYGPGAPDSCRIQLWVDDLRQALALNDDQVAEIKKIHYAHLEDVKSLSKKYQGDCVGEREARWNLRAEMDNQIKALLTEEQKNEYDSFMDGRRGPHGRGNKSW